jgi:hypothetical protein
VVLVRRNYQFEKRQKDLARKRKQEEKLQKRRDRKDGAPDEAPPVDRPGEDTPPHVDQAVDSADSENLPPET